MPALHLLLRWPDGSRDSIYSPSTIVRQFFVAGRSYPLAEFLPVARRAMQAASERVRERYGMPCGRAAASLGAIEARARAFTDGSVTLEKFEQEPG